MTAKSEVFYFPSQTRQLFGILHPPTATSRGEGIILCYPAPQEIMRTYQAHVQLSRMLAALGYTVLRFDYSCTGDSDGESSDASLDQWECDTLAAVSHLKKQHGLQRITLLGTRLGGTLALRASAHGGIAQLVLWDPIIDGLNYMQQMETSHRAMLERESTEAPFPSPHYHREQCWGFPWTAPFKAELAAISPATLTTYTKKIHLVQSQPQYESWAQGLSEKLIAVERHNVEEAIRWNDDLSMRMRAFPTVTLRTLTRILGGAA